MKYIFVSDIHGNVEGLNIIVNKCKEENVNKLIILGDTAASVDREDNIKLADILNELKDKVEVIRGNCDTIEFEDLLNFQIFDIDTLYVNNKFVTVTHGHYYNCWELPSNCGEIFIQGHTHIPMLKKENGRILANPGSITRPRGCDLRCYLFLDEEKVSLKTLDGKLVKEIKCDSVDNAL